MKLIKLINADYNTLKNLIKISFILTATYFFFLFIKEKIDILSFLHLTFLFFINFYLFHMYLSLKKEENYIPIYPMIILFYLTTYSGYFLFTQDMVNMSRFHFMSVVPENLLQLDSIHYVVFLIYLGLTSFSIGYFLPNYFNIRNKPLNLVEVNKYEIPLILVFIIFIIFYYINYYNRFVSLSLLTQLKSPIMLFLLAFFIIKYSATKKIIFSILFLITFFPLFIIETSFGATVFPFMFVAIAFLVNFYNTKKINIINIIFVVICIFTIHSMKYELRKITWIFDEEIIKAEKDIVKKNKDINLGKNISQYSGEQQSKDSQRKIGDSVILNNVRTTFTIADSWLLKRNKTINTKDNLAGQQNRLLHSNKSLQIVITKTPRNVDFFNGRSYQTIIYKLIPRFLWKNKPREEWGNFWGKRYGVLSPEDFHTSWNLPIMNEFYANFGLKGLVVGMFILGLIIKALLLVLQSDIRNPILLSACSTIMLNFFYQEYNLSLLLGKVINQTVFFAVIIFGILITDILIKKLLSEINKIYNN